MSFEGHYQLLCESGHESSADCYEYYDGFEGWECRCGAPLAWWNLVNETNGSYCTNGVGPRGEWDEGVECTGCEWCDNGRIDGWVELEERTPMKTETCNLGHVHVVKEATYKIPEGKGHLAQSDLDRFVKEKGKEFSDKVLSAQIKKTVNEYDPIRLIAMGAPEDEYESEIPDIIAALKKSDSSEELRLNLVEVLERWFGGPTIPGAFSGLADKIWELKE